MIKEETLKAMMPYLTTEYGNPSSIDKMGVRAKAAIEKSRKDIAGHIGCLPKEIIFTSGGSEANNIIIKSLLFNKTYQEQGGAILTTKIEHHSILEAAYDMGRLGCKVKYIPVDSFGLIHLSDVEQIMEENKVDLIAISSCNNEIGTMQNIEGIYNLIQKQKDNRPLLHVDNVQGMAHLPYSYLAGICDSFSFSGHKFGAPKGIGGLYLNKSVDIHGLISGGGQEYGLRAGTENVAGIVGMAAAMDNHTMADNDRVAHLTDLLYELIMDIDGSQMNSFYHDLRVPGIVNISFRGVDSEALMMMLEQRGVIVSAGSACTAGAHDPSHVLRGINISDEYLHGTIRISLGDQNTKKDVKYIAIVLAEAVQMMQMQDWGDIQ